MDNPTPTPPSPPDVDASHELMSWPSITAVERDTGLGKDTLRVWERRYGFPVPQRDAHGERRYPPDQVDKLRLLKRLIDHGHRPGRTVALEMADLRRLAEPLGAAESAVDTTVRPDVDELLELLLAHRLESLRHRLMGLQLRLGLERTLGEVILPLSTRIGDAWMRGGLEVFQEHAVSELLQTQLRQAIATMPPVAWDRHAGGADADRPRIVLTTLPGEPHGLALLMAEALLRLDGVPCRSLGPQTPVWDIVLAAQAWQADVVVLAISSSLGPNPVLAALQELRAKLPSQVALWAGGSAPVLFRRPVPGVLSQAELPELAAAARRWRRSDASAAFRALSRRPPANRMPDAAARDDGPAGPTWLLVLGDQLSLAHPALAILEPGDRVLMIEAPGEATAVWSHQARIALFRPRCGITARALRERGHAVDYVELGDSAVDGLADRLAERFAACEAPHRPARLLVMEPGEWRLVGDLERVARQAGVPLRWLDDPHFLCARADFARWAQGATVWRMEDFYRAMRRRYRVLLDGDGEPVGGRWNFDTDNRRAYGRDGPPALPAPSAFTPDALTREVLAEVRHRYGDHPGSLDDFAWAVTRREALTALRRFVAERLPAFGEHQDAMWTDTPCGAHSLLASALNLHLLDPREVVAAAEAAWRAGAVPLASAEGFIRQILGWREYMRGVYWQFMPGLAEANHYRHHRPLPGWYWTGETRMACVRDVVTQTLRLGHAHHIQRLMVTGLFALLAGVEPKQVAAWYLAVYVDAVEWVELPNVASMALYADGGRVTSKPYLASGAYIDRMSNYCGGCAYAPDAKRAEKLGRAVCPFTVMYWGFVDRHADALARNPRTAPMVRNLERFSGDERAGIRRAAAGVWEDLESL